MFKNFSGIVIGDVIILYFSRVIRKIQAALTLAFIKWLGIFAIHSRLDRNE